jgi:hypothetical protein
MNASTLLVESVSLAEAASVLMADSWQEEAIQPTL